MYFCYFSNSWPSTLTYMTPSSSRERQIELHMGTQLSGVYKYSPLGMGLYWPKQCVVVNWM